MVHNNDNVIDEIKKIIGRICKTSLFELTTYSSYDKNEYLDLLGVLYGWKKNSEDNVVSNILKSSNIVWNERITEAEKIILLEYYDLAVFYLIYELCERYPEWRQGHFLFPKELFELIKQIMGLSISDKIYVPFAGLESIPSGFKEQFVCCQYKRKITWAVCQILEDINGITSLEDTERCHPEWYVGEYYNNHDYEVGSQKYMKVPELLKNLLKEPSDDDLDQIINETGGNERQILSKVINFNFNQIINELYDTDENPILAKVILAYIYTNNIICIPPFETDLLSLATYIEYCYGVLFDTGNLCAIVPTRFLYDTEDYDLRKKFVESGSIKYIVVIPKSSYSYNDETWCLLFIDKQQHSEVCFVDASNRILTNEDREILDVDSIMSEIHAQNSDDVLRVSNETIKNEKYILMWTHFIDDKTLDLNCPIFPMDNCNGISLLEEKRIPSAHNIKYLSLYTLSNNAINYYVDIDELPLGANEPALLVEEPALFISKANSLRPTFVNASKDNPVAYNDSIIALRVDPMVINISYLALQIEKKNRILFDDVHAPILTVEEILRQRINVPNSIEKQIQIFKQVEYERKTAQAKELKLEKIIKQMKDEYLKVVSSRKHNMISHMNQLSSFQYLMNKLLSQSDNVEEIKQRGLQYMERFAQAYNSLSSILETFSKEERYGKREIINIEDFLKSRYRDGINYHIYFVTDYKSLSQFGIDVDISPQNDGINDIKKSNALINIDKESLISIFDNIVSNAEHHGFVDKEKNYKLCFSISIDPARYMYKIVVGNDGAPFPDDINKERYGMNGVKSGETGNTGEGGFIIKQILDEYNGDYDIGIKTTDNGYWNTITIYIPIYKDEK